MKSKIIIKHKKRLPPIINPAEDRNTLSSPSIDLSDESEDQLNNKILINENKLKTNLLKIKSQNERIYYGNKTYFSSTSSKFSQKCNSSTTTSNSELNSFSEQQSLVERYYEDNVNHCLPCIKKRKKNIDNEQNEAFSQTPDELNSSPRNAQDNNDLLIDEDGSVDSKNSNSTINSTHHSTPLHEGAVNSGEKPKESIINVCIQDFKNWLNKKSHKAENHTASSPSNSLVNEETDETKSWSASLSVMIIPYVTQALAIALFAMNEIKNLLVFVILWCKNFLMNYFNKTPIIEKNEVKTTLLLIGVEGNKNVDNLSETLTKNSSEDNIEGSSSSSKSYIVNEEVKNEIKTCAIFIGQKLKVIISFLFFFCFSFLCHAVAFITMSIMWFIHYVLLLLAKILLFPSIEKLDNDFYNQILKKSKNTPSYDVATYQMFHSLIHNCVYLMRIVKQYLRSIYCILLILPKKSANAYPMVMSSIKEFIICLQQFYFSLHALLLMMSNMAKLIVFYILCGSQFFVSLYINMKLLCTSLTTFINLLYAYNSCVIGLIQFMAKLKKTT